VAAATRNQYNLFFRHYLFLGGQKQRADERQ
jgi:hypothetical protein